MKSLLSEFKAICAAHAIVPIMLFVPIPDHMYAEYSTEKSGANWLQVRKEQVDAKTNLEDALKQLSKELDVAFMSFSPAFESAAK